MFADTIINTLSLQELVVVTGTAPTVEMALELMAGAPPDVVIYVDTHGGARDALCTLTSHYPEMAFIRAELTSGHLRLITSKCIRARSDELVAAITALPRGSYSENGGSA